MTLTDDAEHSGPDLVLHRRAALHSVRERVRILFVNTQEVAPIAGLGLAPYRQWIAEVTGTPADRVEVVNVADGDPLPATVEAHGVIGGGSGHSAFEDLPWIGRTKDFFRAVQRAGVPELHICWSHQAKAEAHGGRAAPGEAGRRFGIERLRLTAAGRHDPLFRDLPDEFEVFTSHVDVVTALPRDPAPVELARSDTYPYEALAYGPTARTIQAHPELTSPITAALADSRRDRLVREGLVGPADADYAEFLDELHRQDKQIRETGRQLFDNWLLHFVGPRFRDLPPGQPREAR
ncbi:type 1 glutamine amidotransferase [Actinomadura craniellae]|uniref:type 1 glutamine amidotransferase n=1 Tax=Actinomadura craniellae TaxID=2231787 RepID=UPI001313F90B|nr:type 1 glutamine amidotransferase [Actinomadura craniellae]